MQKIFPPANGLQLDNSKNFKLLVVNIMKKQFDLKPLSPHLNLTFTFEIPLKITNNFAYVPAYISA